MKTKIIASIVLIIVLLLSIICFNYNIRVGNSIEDIIVQAIKIQYGWKSKRFLSDITTENFQLNMGDNFYQGGYFYLLSDDSFTKSAETKNTLEISVGVEDFKGRYIQIFTLEKTSDDQYLISNIEYDK